MVQIHLVWLLLKSDAPYSLWLNVTQACELTMELN
jgi:hypothetical protein